MALHSGQFQSPSRLGGPPPPPTSPPPPPGFGVRHLKHWYLDANTIAPHPGQVQSPSRLSGPPNPPPPPPPPEYAPPPPLRSSSFPSPRSSPSYPLPSRAGLRERSLLRSILQALQQRVDKIRQASVYRYARARTNTRTPSRAALAREDPCGACEGSTLQQDIRRGCCPKSAHHPRPVTKPAQVLRARNATLTLTCALS